MVALFNFPLEANISSSVDPQVFFASFIASYIIFFLSVACLLYIHPYWQQRCFKLIEDFKYRCYYPVFDTLKRFPNCLEP
jgi:hypothetical protein